MRTCEIVPGDCCEASLPSRAVPGYLFIVFKSVHRMARWCLGSGFCLGSVHFNVLLNVLLNVFFYGALMAMRKQDGAQKEE